MQGSKRQRRRHRPAHRDPRRDERAPARGSARRPPTRGRPCGISSTIVPNPISASWRDQQVGGDDQSAPSAGCPWAGCAASARSPAAPPCRSRLAAAARRSLSATSSCAREIAHVRRQGRPLEVRQRFGRSRRRRRRRPPRAARASGRRARSTRRAARPRRCRAPTAARRASPPRGRRASGPSSTTSTLLAFSRPCEMPGRVQARHLLPQLPRASRRCTCSPARVLERLDVRLPRDDECVAVGVRGGRDHLGHPDACLRGHQRRQRLVLDLLESPDGDAPRRIPVGERAPAPGEPLRVLRVAAEDAHPQRPRRRGRARRTRPRRSAAVGGRLSGRRPRRRARRALCGCPRPAASPLPFRSARRTSAAAAEAERHGAQAPDGRAAPSTTAPKHRERDQPSGEHANRADELRAGDCDERRPRTQVAGSGNPHRDHTSASITQPVGLDHTTQNASRPRARSAAPTSRSRASAQRRRRRTSTAITQRENQRGDERCSPERFGPAETP